MPSSSPLRAVWCTATVVEEIVELLGLPEDADEGGADWPAAGLPHSAAPLLSLQSLLQ